MICKYFYNTLPHRNFAEFDAHLSANQEQLLVLMGRNFKAIFKSHFDAAKLEEYRLLSEKTFVEGLVMTYGEQLAQLTSDPITHAELER